MRKIVILASTGVFLSATLVSCLHASQPQERAWIEKVDLQLTKLPSVQVALEMMKDKTGRKMLDSSAPIF